MTSQQMLVASAILLFVWASMFWGRKTMNVILDEREMLVRLKVNSFVSKSVEYTLIAVTLFYLLVMHIDGLPIILAIGLVGSLAQAFANYYFRREDSSDSNS